MNTVKYYKDEETRIVIRKVKIAVSKRQMNGANGKRLPTVSELDASMAADGFTRERPKGVRGYKRVVKG